MSDEYDNPENDDSHDEENEEQEFSLDQLSAAYATSSKNKMVMSRRTILPVKAKKRRRIALLPTSLQNRTKPTPKTSWTTRHVRLIR